MDIIPPENDQVPLKSLDGIRFNITYAFVDNPPKPPSYGEHTEIFLTPIDSTALDTNTQVCRFFMPAFEGTEFYHTQRRIDLIYEHLKGVARFLPFKSCLALGKLIKSTNDGANKLLSNIRKLGFTFWASYHNQLPAHTDIEQAYYEIFEILLSAGEKRHALTIGQLKTRNSEAKKSIKTALRELRKSFIGEQSLEKLLLAVYYLDPYAVDHKPSNIPHINLIEFFEILLKGLDYELGNQNNPLSQDAISKRHEITKSLERVYQLTDQYLEKSRTRATADELNEIKKIRDKESMIYHTSRLDYHATLNEVLDPERRKALSPLEDNKRKRIWSDQTALEEEIVKHANRYFGKPCYQWCAELITVLTGTKTYSDNLRKRVYTRKKKP